MSLISINPQITFISNLIIQYQLIHTKFDNYNKLTIINNFGVRYQHNQNLNDEVLIVINFSSDNLLNLRM